jgi:hypothetical protein
MAACQIVRLSAAIPTVSLDCPMNGSMVIQSSSPQVIVFIISPANSSSVPASTKCVIGLVTSF